MNLPNSLTVTRIFLVPLLVVVLLTKFEGHSILGVPKELVGAAILALILAYDPAHTPMYPLFVIGQVALWVVVAAALVSAADYFRRFNVIVNPRVTDIEVARDRKVG